jgi:multidrug efflux pump subunit AcrA (membrane-fusion protein)
MVDTGHFIPPGTPQPLFIVAQEDRVRVVVEVPEADAPLIRTGLTATVVIPSLKTKAFEGPLARTAWSLEPGSRTLRVEIDLDNAELRLRPGMYVTARIAAPRPEAFVVPTGALTRLSEQTVCYRAVDGQAVRTPVAVGFSDGQRTEMIRWQASDGTWHDWSAEVAVVTPAAAVVEGQKVP